MGNFGVQRQLSDPRTIKNDSGRKAGPRGGVERPEAPRLENIESSEVWGHLVSPVAAHGERVVHADHRPGVNSDVLENA